MRFTAWHVALAVSTVSHALILGFAPAEVAAPPAGQQAAVPITLTVVRVAAAPASETRPTRVSQPPTPSLPAGRMARESRRPKPEALPAPTPVSAARSPVPERYTRAAAILARSDSVVAAVPPSHASFALSTGSEEDSLPARPAAGVNAPPTYPRRAREHGWQGTVLLAVDIDPTGRVTSVRIADSSGHAILDRAARDAVRDWRFEPAHTGGVALSSTVRLPVIFRLTARTDAP